MNFNCHHRSFITLPNGMRVVFIPMKQIDMVSIYLRVGTGSNYEFNYLGSGISHFVEHAIFLGSKRLPGKDEFSKLVEGYGAIDFNAYTTYDHTAYFFSVFSAHLEKALKAFQDFVFYPLFRQRDIEEERGSILSEMDMYEDQVGDWFYHFIQYGLFPTQPYKLPVIGIREKFETIDFKAIKKYHDEHYQPHQLVLTLAGHFEVESVQKMVQKIFWDEKVMERSLPTDYKNFKEEEVLQQDKFYLTTHRRTEFIKISFVWETVSSEEVDSNDRFGLDLLAYLLASGKGSLIYDEFKEKIEWVEQVSAYATSPRERGHFLMTFSLSHSDRIDLIGQSEVDQLEKKSLKIEKELYRFFNQIETMIDEEILAGAKNTFLKGMIDQQENNLELATMVSESLVLHGHLEQDRVYLERIKGLTPPDIHRLVRKYFISLSKTKQAKHRFFLLPQDLYQKENIRCWGKNKMMKEQTDFYADLLEDLENKNYQLAEVEHLNYSSNQVKNTDLSIPEVGKTIRSKLLSDLRNDQSKGQTKGTLLTHFSNRLPKTYLVFRSQGGFLQENNAYLGLDQQNLNTVPISASSILSRMLFASNQRFEKKELFQVLRHHGISYHAFNGEDFLGFSLSFLSDRFEVAMQLASSILLNDSFKLEDLEQEKKDLVYEIKKARESIDYLSSLHFRKALLKGTRLALPDEGDISSIERVTLDHLNALKKRWFKQDQMVVSLSGSYQRQEEDKLKSFLKQDLIGQDGDQVDFFEFNLTQSTLSDRPDKWVFDYEKNCKQSIFHLAYKTAPLNHRDSFALEVLNSYLSGLGGPLFQLRSANFEKNGVSLGGRAYRLGSYYKFSNRYGWFVFYINFREEAQNEYHWGLASFLELINSLKKRPIPIIELERAKNRLMAKDKLSSSRLFYQTEQKNIYEFLGLGYESWEQKQQALNEVTSMAVLEVVNRYFQDDFLAHIVLPQKD